MTLLPKIYSYICDSCFKPFNSQKELEVFGKETICKDCQKEIDHEYIGKLIAELDDKLVIFNQREEEIYPLQNSKTIKFELRGDDLQIIKKIKQYSSIEDENIYSWLCYLENEIKEQLYKEEGE